MAISGFLCLVTEAEAEAEAEAIAVEQAVRGYVALHAVDADVVVAGDPASREDRGHELGAVYDHVEALFE